MCCNCNNRNTRCKPHSFVDVTCQKAVPISEVTALLGLDSCGNIVPVEIPDFVTYDEDDNIQARNHIILKNSASLLGTTVSGGQINLAQCSEYSDEGHPIADLGSTSAHMTLNSYDRTNVQLYGESGNHDHQVAYLSDISAT